MNIFEQILNEKNKAVSLHGNFTSLHEAYAVLLEEVDEVWDIVKQKTEDRNIDNLKKELIQVAAICVKTIEYLDSKQKEVKHESGSVWLG